MNDKLKYWAPRFGIVGSVIGIITGAFAFYKSYISSATCEELVGNYKIELTVKKADTRGYLKETYVYNVHFKEDDGFTSFTGSQFRYKGKEATMQRAFDGTAKCENDLPVITYTWKESEKGGKDITGTIWITSLKDSIYSGTWEHSFNNQSGSVRIFK
jgi:hypothetical protein